MKKFIFFVLLSLSSLSMCAQLKSIKVFQHTDTLIVNTSNSSIGEDGFVDFFKGQQGYCFKRLFTNHYNSTSTNNSFSDKISFFDNPTFYIGETPKEAIVTLNELLKFCRNDIATRADVNDFKGNFFHIHVASALNLERKPTYTEGDRLLIWNAEMEEPMTLLQKTIEDTLKYLTRLP